MPTSANQTATSRMRRTMAACGLALGLVSAASIGAAQAPQAGKPRPPQATTAPPASASASAPIEVAADYVLGPTDVLSVVFWGEKELTSEVTVRPDGKISLPLLNDVVAAGLTPEQLRRRLTDLAKRFLDTPVVTVVVKQVNNNLVFVTGQVLRSGSYVLSGHTTVLHVIALAGGFTEFADRKHVLITRIENGVQRAFTFNYDDVVKRQDLKQNLILKAGDTVVVP